MTPRLPIPLRAIPYSRLTLTHSAASHLTAPCKRPLITWREIKSRILDRSPFSPSLPFRDLMSFREPESPSLEQRPNKRRRILETPEEEEAKTIMAKETDISPSSLPRITLTPIEQALRLCLLDAAEYIQQRPRNDTETTAITNEPLVLRFAGGWVRDKLLGAESHDIDVAINSMTGEKFGEGLKEYLDIPGNLDKYRNHAGVATAVDFIKLHKIEKNPEKSKHLETSTTKIFGLDIDLVNLRKETYTDDSRNPQIEMGTPEEDALRRDATVNSLFYNIHTESVEDFTGKGLQDMAHKIIRTPMAPFQTFKDDPLRVLRLLRFASRLGYTIDKETEDAMKIEDIKLALKAKITRERVGVEIEKTLRGPDPLTALQRINRLGLYDTIFANLQDDAMVDTSTWERAYNSLALLLSNPSDDNVESHKTRQYLRDMLIRDDTDLYYAWFLAAVAPWTTVPDPTPSKPTKPVTPRATTVARDSLCANNKACTIISAASKYHRMISDFESSFLNDKIAASPIEARVATGQFIRTLGQDWRSCFVLAMVLEAMQGQEADQVFGEYEKLLAYIERSDLLDAVALRPLINGRDIMNGLGVKTGPWMGKAVEMVMEWQLRNPQETSKEAAMNEIIRRKDELDLDTRESLKAVNDSIEYHVDAPSIEPNIRLQQLWSEISAIGSSATTEDVCENLFLVEAVLRTTNPDHLQREDREAARYLIFWVADAILPSRGFTQSWEQAQLSDCKDAILSTLAKHKLARLKSSVGVSVIELLNLISPINELELDDAVDIVTALAALTCKKDPWTTERAYDKASTILENYESFLRSSSKGELSTVLEVILTKKVKPLFSKTKTPAVTAAGRKNVHPVPQPRFDPSIFDPESKPWKFKDVYVVTVLSWVIGRYSPSDQRIIESQFPLLVPAILSLIDDETLSFKAKGCELLSNFLVPLEESGSDMLKRTNLDSVFQDALTPCLLSLPTITPEPESIHLLQYAYSALLAVIRTRFPPSQFQYPSPSPRTTQPTSKQDNDSQKRLESLTRLLRHSILHSYHHTSNPRPIENTSISSYPYPRLSALLLSQLPPVFSELGIHTTKHLQDLVPMLSATLSNPFGTAYPPLLSAAAEATRMLVLNAWPRIWRWRAEVLDGLCACWLHVREDSEDVVGASDASAGDWRKEDLKKLQRALKEVVGVLKIAVEECSVLVPEEGAGAERAQEKNSEVIDVQSEFGKLVEGDEKLNGLLIGNEYFDTQ
ncbi:hypothetical protein AJ79_07404 [Helicocarpus griseus UAMH5409]|uniref:Poly A polymerase head domain-containing protein n=1 Tax=Helicocarpus griseus UAMH5409 TaxID=1447875 RepID=A0A2B7X2P8_9EURO|nr:hypothetical protein AJ79_07404 [Helicocarpus griseus UAMH5409]